MNLVLRLARRVLPSRLGLMAAASAGTLGLVGLAALAGAAVPTADGKINGCYDKSTGNLRVIDTAKDKCKVSEVAISWNQAGSPGPQGDEGPAGPTGPQGPAGQPGGGVAALADLDGIDCTTVHGDQGTLAVSYGEGTSIVFDCMPVNGCGDDTHGDLPSEAISLGAVSGDNPNQAGPVSATGMICPGDVDYFTVAINESSAENLNLAGMIRLQMQPGVPLSLTTEIDSASGQTAVTPANNPDIWTLDLDVSVTDGAADNFLILLIKVEGVAPHITGPYTLSVFGALE